LAVFGGPALGPGSSHLERAASMSSLGGFELALEPIALIALAQVPVMEIVESFGPLSVAELGFVAT